MELALFSPDLYQAHKEAAGHLTSDIKLLTEIRKTWQLDMASRMFDSYNAVGSYDTHMSSVIAKESVAWTRKLRSFPSVSLPTVSPPRLGFIARGTTLMEAMAKSYTVPNLPFWNAVAEQIYGYVWCLLDNNVLCQRCVHGACSSSLFGTYCDYLHFYEQLPQVLEACAQRMIEYIQHVHHDHAADSKERMVMDAWLMSIQAVYLDVLHSKSEHLQFPDDELGSIQYRLVNSAARPLALQAWLEQMPLIDDNDIMDAVAFAAFVMHDICDCRHDKAANEYYNLMIIISGHNGVLGVNMIRRFCIDVWAWAIDNGAFWAIHFGGRFLAWQTFAARYQTAILLDNLVAPEDNNQSKVEPYGDQVLNGLNPLPPSPEPFNFDLRFRCQNTARYDSLLQECLAHFESCDTCHGYDTATWQERVPLTEASYQKKYTDCTCTNVIATYLILASMDQIWLVPDPSAKYTGPSGDWSPMLC
ncbi:hypothetical protein BDV25DRAFT_152954 [Aspergillus avenaceus]|uniref:Uncharacterized protein n=1 Tax=Aspergillus avenaceus TaxID=36643 RepID=A0A5N6TY51_ASPAV|nr:hypothetical protein BDV25DRAFT_152954 [Aspergillus avenaceus]